MEQKNREEEEEEEETLRVKASRRPGEMRKSGGAVRSHTLYRTSHAGRHVKVNVL